MVQLTTLEETIEFAKDIEFWKGQFLLKENGERGIFYSGETEYGVEIDLSRVVENNRYKYLLVVGNAHLIAGSFGLGKDRKKVKELFDKIDARNCKKTLSPHNRFYI